MGENDRWSGAVKPIPVLLLGTTCLEQATRDGWKVVPDGGDGVEMAWWRRCESSVGLGGIEGESRETERQNSGSYHESATVMVRLNCRTNCCMHFNVHETR